MPRRRPCHRFSGDRRVKASADFKRAFDASNKLARGELVGTNSAKISSRYFIVPIFFVPKSTDTSPRRAQTTPRLGVVVSKKVSKRAVDRNRIKRLVRESFRQANLPETEMDLIVVAKRHAASVDNETLFLDLTHVWRKIRKTSPQNT